MPERLPTPGLGHPGAPVPDLLVRLADQLSEGVYVADAAGVITYANRACSEHLGLNSAEELEGRTLECHWAETGTVSTGEGSAEYRHRLITPRGEEVWLRERRSIFADDGGNHLGTIGLLERETDTRAPSVARDDPRQGCLVFTLGGADRADSSEGSDAESIDCRDLAHLIVRMTRPEDLVAEIGDGRIVLFADVRSPAALKAIADRVVARGRREVDAAFVVGGAMRRPDEAVADVIVRAEAVRYLAKPRLRGRVTGARSGSPRAA